MKTFQKLQNVQLQKFINKSSWLILEIWSTRIYIDWMLPFWHHCFPYPPITNQKIFITKSKSSTYKNSNNTLKIVSIFVKNIML